MLLRAVGVSEEAKGNKGFKGRVKEAMRVVLKPLSLTTRINKEDSSSRLNRNLLGRCLHRNVMTFV